MAFPASGANPNSTLLAPEPVGQGGRDGPIRRETAHRLFAFEFNNSRHQIPGAGEKDPSFLVSPLGAKVNRLHVVGVCTEVEQVGKSGEMWRARISDPTGVFTVMAGNYQPEASLALSQLQVPCFIAVTGKARTYEPEPGTVFVSIRPESVSVVDAGTRDQWVLDTARRTVERLQATELARANPTATAADLHQKGIPQNLADGVVAAREPYALTELSVFKEMARKSLGYLLPGGIMPVHQESTSPTKPLAPMPTEHVPASWKAPSASPPPIGSPQAVQALADAKAAQSAAEDVFDAKVVASVQSLEGQKGARWDDVLSACGGPGITPEQVEESLNRLMDKGLIYEPTLGVLKTT